MTFSETFREILYTRGLWDAMRWLNADVPYRYSAIFAFEGDFLRNICLVDKHDPAVTKCGYQPILDSYCIYIHRSAERFSVGDAESDKRVQDHPKCRVYKSYYGIPLFGPEGRLAGTVCHFDTTPQNATPGVIAALDELAPCIATAVFSDTRA